MVEFWSDGKDAECAMRKSCSALFWLGSTRASPIVFGMVVAFKLKSGANGNGLRPDTLA